MSAGRTSRRTSGSCSSAGVVDAGLAVAISEAGRRRRDARLLLIGLAFLASAGFLGLHALATPGVLLEKGNAGFVLATPVGLVVAGLLAAASAIEYRLGPRSRSSATPARCVGAVLALSWRVGGAVARRAPAAATRRVTPDDVEAPLGVVALIGVVAYGYAALAYFRICVAAQLRLAFAIAFAFALLAESLVVVLASLATSWQLSWWEWHVLMAISFFTIAAAAQREWFEERFSALYLDETLAGQREVTVAVRRPRPASRRSASGTARRRCTDARHLLRRARADDRRRLRRRGAGLRRRPDLRHLQQARRPARPRAAGRRGRARAATARRGHPRSPTGRSSAAA